jgi:outer membrane protein
MNFKLISGFAFNAKTAIRRFMMTLPVIFASDLAVSAQNTSNDTLNLSLLQAIEFAANNNQDIKNAYADVAISDQTVKEVASIGIPQLKGQVNFQDAIQKQVFVFPNPATGVPAPIRIGNKYTTQASLNLTWLLLDGTYFLGLKAAKQYTDLAKKVASKTESDVKIDVAKTYFMALIVQENIKLLDASLQTLNKTYEQVKALNKEGFTESLDVDRLKLQMNNLEISRQKLNDQYTIVLGLLRSKIGMDQKKPIKLSDNINDLNQQFIVSDLNANADLNTRTDYQILQQQLVLNKYNVKRYQYGKYPNLAGAFTLQESNFGENIDYFNKDKWFQNSFLALQLSVPIFSGFGNDAKIQKAKIEQIKTENTIRKVENLIELEVQQCKLNYLRAMDYVTQQKENLDLATRILKITTIKYNEGVGSNLEMITANQDLKTTQTNYLSAVYDLLVAKLDYQVALGQQIKL